MTSHHTKCFERLRHKLLADLPRKILNVAVGYTLNRISQDSWIFAVNSKRSCGYGVITCNQFSAANRTFPSTLCDCWRIVTLAKHLPSNAILCLDVGSCIAPIFGIPLDRYWVHLLPGDMNVTTGDMIKAYEEMHPNTPFFSVKKSTKR